MKSFALFAIQAYQRHISPYKGFCCAYRLHTGRASCSALGFRAIRLHGVWLGLRVLRQRMALCGVAHRRFALDAPRRVPLKYQRGDCDIGGCDGLPDMNCDMPSGKSLGRVCDWFSCCDLASGCDWPSRDKKGAQRRKSKEADVHIPPKRHWPRWR